MNNVLLKDLGVIDYKEAWDKQEELFNKIVSQKKENKDETDNYFLFCEHPHVYTLGKSGAENNLLINSEFLKKIDATYYKINRGGDITYHGFGQIVGYPILNLELLNLGIKSFINNLEEVIIQTLKEYEITATRFDGATGVWLDVNTPNARKICAIGVRTSHWVSMHGFALNVNTDLTYFNHINPCGFVDKGVTSLEKELGKKVDLQEVKNIISTKFEDVFQVKLS